MMAAAIWKDLPQSLPDLVVDAFTIMPDHFHAIFGFGRSICFGTAGQRTDVPRVIQCFKTLTMQAYRAGVADHGWPRYRDHLWQRGYMDRVLRNDADLEVHREYIYYNTLQEYMSSEQC